MNNILTPNEGLHNCMNQADYTRIARNLWGGTKIGLSEHALHRSINRYYQYMSHDLLFHNILDVLSGEEIERRVLSR